MRSIVLTLGILFALILGSCQSEETTVQQSTATVATDTAVTPTTNLDGTLQPVQADTALQPVPTTEAPAAPTTTSQVPAQTPRSSAPAGVPVATATPARATPAAAASTPTPAPTVAARPAPTVAATPAPTVAATPASTPRKTSAKLPKTHTVDHGGVMHAPGSDNPLQKCAACHGKDLRGGKVASVSCYGCHDKNW